MRHARRRVLGKAYDARLMRRLLHYLRPYWRAGRARARRRSSPASVAAAGAAVPDQDGHRPLHRGAATSPALGPHRASLYLAILVAAFVRSSTSQTWTLQMTGQRIMFDLRMADLRAPAAPGPALLRPQSGRAADDARDVGRRRAQRPVHLRRRDGVRRRVHAGRHHGRDAVDELAAGAGRLRRAAAHRRSSRSGSAATCATRTASCAAGSRGSTRSCRRTSPGCRRCSCSGARRSNFARFDAIDREHRDANIESIFYYAVFYPAIEVVGALASALIIWYGGAQGAAASTLTLGALVAFLQYSQRFFRPISDMSEKFNVLQSAMASSERIFKLLDEPVAIAVAERARGVGRRRRRGTSSSTTSGSRYNDDATESRTTCCRDVSLRGPAGRARRRSSAPPAPARRRSSTCCCGSTTCSAGGSRSTASTSASWISHDLRGLFSLVLQDVHLFSGTIADNIRLGNAAIDDERVRARPRGGARRRVHRAAAGRLRQRRWPSAARRCRSARSSCCRSRARWRSIRAS